MAGRRRTRAATGLASDMMMAPFVMAMRLPAMAAEAQGRAPVSKETIRAATEKTAALVEGLAAAQLSLVGSAWSFWPELLSGRVPSLVSGAAMERSVEAAMAPAQRTLRANYRRLSRR